eukprot:6732324-Pyramimonas_sp.AAC.1
MQPCDKAHAYFRRLMDNYEDELVGFNTRLERRDLLDDILQGELGTSDRRVQDRLLKQHVKKTPLLATAGSASGCWSGMVPRRALES